MTFEEEIRRLIDTYVKKENTEIDTKNNENVENSENENVESGESENEMVENNVSISDGESIITKEEFKQIVQDTLNEIFTVSNKKVDDIDPVKAFVERPGGRVEQFLKDHGKDNNNG